MENNDILIRLRYALDIKDKDMVEIFKLGGVVLTQEEVKQLLTKDDQTETTEEQVKCNNQVLESFLNGFIIFKRGKQEPKPGQAEKPVLVIKDHENINNVLLKKLKIALALNSDDMLDIFKLAGLTVTKGELSALFRKEGHKNYKECGDKYARNFLKGLAMRYRG